MIAPEVTLAGLILTGSARVRRALAAIVGDRRVRTARSGGENREPDHSPRPLTARESGDLPLRWGLAGAKFRGTGPWHGSRRPRGTFTAGHAFERWRRPSRPACRWSGWHNCRAPEKVLSIGPAIDAQQPERPVAWRPPPSRHPCMQLVRSPGQGHVRPWASQGSPHTHPRSVHQQGALSPNISTDLFAQPSVFDMLWNRRSTCSGTGVRLRRDTDHLPPWRRRPHSSRVSPTLRAAKLSDRVRNPSNFSSRSPARQIRAAT